MFKAVGVCVGHELAELLLFGLVGNPVFHEPFLSCSDAFLYFLFLDAVSFQDVVLSICKTQVCIQIFIEHALRFI